MRIRTHLILHLKWVNFIANKLNLNKTDFLTKDVYNIKSDFLKCKNKLTNPMFSCYSLEGSSLVIKGMEKTWV